MALSIVQSNSAAKGAVSAAQAITLASAVSAGDILCLAILWAVSGGGSTGTTFTVADTGTGNGANTWTAATASREAVVGPNYPEIGVEFYYVTGANAASAESVSILPSQTVNLELALWDISTGAFFGASVGTGTKASGAGAAQSASLTPGQNGAVGLAATVFDDGGGGAGISSAGTGYTLDLSGGGGNQDYATEHIAQATAAALTGAINLNSTFTGTWVANQIIFQPSGSTPPSPYVPLSRMPLGC